MATCSCGVTLKEFWLWRDDQSTPHASAFRPAIEPEVSYWAATARDALTPLSPGVIPKHDIRSSAGANISSGRCQSKVPA